jgi:hypothetical protein
MRPVSPNIGAIQRSSLIIDTAMSLSYIFLKKTNINQAERTSAHAEITQNYPDFN